MYSKGNKSEQEEPGEQQPAQVRREQRDGRREHAAEHVGRHGGLGVGPGQRERRLQAHVPHLSKVLQDAEHPAAAHAHTHGRQAVRVRPVQQGLQSDGQPQVPPGHALGRSTVQV